MKKTLALLLGTLLLLAAACAEETVFPPLAWETDPANHWQLDASGAIVNQGAHDSGDSWTCSVCGSDILVWDDGSADVTDYDAYGNTVRFTTYDENGEVTYQSRHVLTCNEDGIILKDQEYLGGQLYSETTYTVNENGEQIPTGSHSWYEDGTSASSQYDEFGNCVYSATYDENGVVDCEIFCEFAPIEDEWFGLYYYECKNLIRYPSGEFFSHETNEYGDHTRVLNVNADGVAWADYVYEYEYKNGQKTLALTYTQDVLVREEIFNDDECIIQETEFLKDGGKVVYRYNDNTDLYSETSYAADGSVQSHTDHEYEYTEDGSILSYRAIVDGRLEQESIYRYELDEDGDECYVGKVEIFYYEDGTRTETEYDNWLTAIREVTYAADGTILSEEIFEYEEETFEYDVF